MRRYRINWDALKPDPKPKKKPTAKQRYRRRLSVFILIIALIILTIIRLPYEYTIHKLENLGYDRRTAEIIRKDRLDQRIIDYRYYSDYLSECFQKGTVNGDYLPLYLEVYNDRELTADDFLLCQRLQDAGYETDQIQNLFANLSYSEICPLLLLSYQYNEDTYIEDVQNGRQDDGTFTLEGDYTDYYERYTTLTEVTSQSLINKNNLLDAGYVPADLTTIDTEFAVDGVEMSSEAAAAFTQMAEAAAADGIWFYATDGYCDYASQENLFNSAVQNLGSDGAEYYVPHAGASEHQAGLAVDVTAPNQESEDFSTTDAYNWLNEHAAEYGFILRYPDNMDLYTGYGMDPTHLRYLGKDLAEQVKASGLAYDLYYALYLKTWNDASFIPADNVLNSTSYPVTTEQEKAEVTTADPSASPAASASAQS